MKLHYGNVWKSAKGKERCSCNFGKGLLTRLNRVLSISLFWNIYIVRNFYSSPKEYFAVIVYITYIWSFDMEIFKSFYLRNRLSKLAISRHTHGPQFFLLLTKKVSSMVKNFYIKLLKVFSMVQITKVKDCIYFHM